MGEVVGDLSWECYRIPGLIKPDQWRRLIEQQLESDGCPYAYDVYGQALRIWLCDTPEIKIPGSSHTCRNAFRVQRVAFGGDRDATLIGITIARVFFEDGKSIPSFRSTEELFKKGRYPEVLRHEVMLEGIGDLIKYISSSPDLVGIKAYSDFEVADASREIIYRTAEGETSLLELTRGGGLSKNLLQLVRDNVALEPVTVRLGLLSKITAQAGKAAGITSHIVRVLQDWGCVASSAVLGDAEAVENFIADQGEAGIVLVPLDGKRGDRPPEHALEWIRYLDAENAAFQLCSTSSNPIYSRHGLAMAILLKAGGTHFRTHPAEETFFKNAWFIGLDLGRGGQREGRIAAITLTDSTGALKAYWRALKDNTESLPLDVLSHGLRWILSQAEEQSQGRNIVLIRDGRCPRDENLDHYKMAMGKRKFTFLEYMKRGNPLMHIGSDEPNPGTILIPGDSPFSAIYPCLAPQKGILSNPVKVRIRINPDKLSHYDIGVFLTSLCHAATLSFQASGVPAPLQWSNGLAKLSYSDLQFSGWSHLPHHTVDLR